MNWTDARISLAKDLFHQKKSAAQAAIVLGDGLSRNAVQGFWFRQGLMRGRAPAKPRPPRVKRDRIRLQRAVPFKPAPKPVEIPPEEPKSLAVPFSQRTRRQCSWIAGEPSAEATCCGHKVQAGSSYCGFHHKIVWVKSEKRAR